MLAILFVLGITIGPLIAAACALIAAEKGNYARAAVYHIVYMAGSMLWCLLPPLGLNLGILSAPGADGTPFKFWAFATAAAAAILVIELYCYRSKYHNFFLSRFLTFLSWCYSSGYFRFSL